MTLLQHLRYRARITGARTAPVNDIIYTPRLWAAESRVGGVGVGGCLIMAADGESIRPPFCSSWTHMLRARLICRLQLIFPLEDK